MSTNNAAHTPALVRFHISYRNAAYRVSIPMYEGGEVVNAEAYDALAEQRAELLEAVRIARSHIAATGWPTDSRGIYDEHGEWSFDAMTRNRSAVDAGEIKKAFQVLSAAILKFEIRQ